MRRLLVLVAATAAMTVPLIAAAGVASADPLEPLRVIDVFVTGDGNVCVTYNDLTTACTTL